MHSYDIMRFFEVLKKSFTKQILLLTRNVLKNQSNRLFQCIQNFMQSILFVTVATSYKTSRGLIPEIYLIVLIMREWTLLFIMEFDFTLQLMSH